MGYFLGVDLGTTFVGAAVARDRRTDMVPLGDRSVVMPAVVYVRDDGGLVTGDAAARRLVSSPDRVAAEIKRRLGDPTPLMLGGTAHPVVDLLGTLLRAVLDRVAAEQGGPPDLVVLTHPANWGPYRRKLFEEVPRFAGIENARTVSEPEAAAAHYAATRDMAPGEVIAVYDFGGGTFDATVLVRGHDGIDVLGTPAGIERLGGADLDEAVLAFVNHASGGALAQLDLGDPRTAVALARLRQDCVLAKEALSVDTETIIPVFLPGRHLDVTLTREQFEQLIRARVESTVGTLDRALRSAQLPPDRLSTVLLIGGSSQIPLVARMVAEQLGCSAVVDPHPKHAVALGAAMVARTAAGQAPDAAVAPRPRVPARAAALAPPLTGPTARAPAGAVAAVADGRIDGPTTAGPVDGAVGDVRRPPEEPPAPSPGTGGPEGSGGADADGPPLPPDRRGSRRGPRPAGSRVALVVGLAVLAMALMVLLMRPWSGSGTNTAAIRSAAPTPPSSAAPSLSSATPAPVTPSVATAMPIPSLGPTIGAGATPGFVAASPDGHQLYVANGPAGTITVIDTAVNAITATIAVPAGPPRYLAFAPNGKRIYVSVWDDARTVAALCVIDATDNELIKTIPMASRPFLPAVSPDGSRIYVPNHDTGNVSVIDTTSYAKLTDIKVPANPHWVAFTPDGKRAYTADHESNVIGIVDTATDAVVGQIAVGRSPHSVAVHPTRPLVANVNYDDGTVSFSDTGTNRVLQTVAVGSHPQHVVWSVDGRFAYVVNDSGKSVSVVDAGNFAVTATIPTGGSPTSIALLPNGKTAYVTNLDDGTLTVLDVGS